MAKKRAGLDLSQHFEKLTDETPAPATAPNPVADIIRRRETLEAYPLRVAPSTLEMARDLAQQMGGQRGAIQDVLRHALELGLAELKQKAGL
jgi:hypothetical protein